MAKIIPFPSKDKFIDQFRGSVPEDIFKHMSEAYDRVEKLMQKYPSAEFQVAPGFDEEATRLKYDFEAYALSLLKRILELEAELCLTARKS